MKIRHIKRDLYKSLKSTFYYYAVIQMTISPEVEWKDEYVYKPDWVTDAMSKTDKWMLGTIVAIFDDGKNLLPMTSWKEGDAWTNIEADIKVFWDGPQTLSYKLLSCKMNERLELFKQMYVGEQSKFKVIKDVGMVILDQNGFVVG